MTLIGVVVGWLLHPPFYLIGVLEAWGADEWDLSDMETWTEYEQRVSVRRGSPASLSSIAG